MEGNEEGKTSSQIGLGGELKKKGEVLILEGKRERVGKRKRPVGEKERAKHKLEMGNKSFGKQSNTGTKRTIPERKKSSRKEMMLNGPRQQRCHWFVSGGKKLKSQRREGEN